jgi:hypothetical protein
MVAHRFIGQSVARIEDAALLTGAGRFVNDVPVLAALQAAFVRSPFAHARIKSIDVATARAAAGVSAVLSYADIRPLLTQDRMPLELRRRMRSKGLLPHNLITYGTDFVEQFVLLPDSDFRRHVYFGLTFVALKVARTWPLGLVNNQSRVSACQGRGCVRTEQQIFGDVITAGICDRRNGVRLAEFPLCPAGLLHKIREARRYRRKQ